MSVVQFKMVSLPQTRPAKKKRGFIATRSVLALILREMSTTYGRSPGGYLWAVLEPAAGITLLTVIFSLAFRSPPLGTSFAFFYATGMLPFLMFNDVNLKVGQSIKFSARLLEYPRVTFADALIARLALSVLTQTMVHIIVMIVIISIDDVHTTFDLTKVVSAIGLVVILAAGLGTLNSFLNVAFPLWQTIWAIFTRPLFIISGIFFLFETVPQPYRDILWYNPFVHIVGIMRDGYFAFHHPQYVSPLYVVAFGAIPGVLGLLLLKRYHRDILNM